MSFDPQPETNLGELAVKIYDEEVGFFEQGTSGRLTEIKLVSGWLEGHLGELNNLIFSSFSGSNPENLLLEEQSILREMYLSEYNRKAERRALRRMDGEGDTINWASIQEGDSVIKRQIDSSNPTPKFYHQAYLVSQERMKELIYAYNLYHAMPRQAVGKDSPESPETSGIYGKTV
tara:strand:- start:10987 stop:11514 length:528 start_codon:yes stop_codon:yes gene_type:complete